MDSVLGLFTAVKFMLENDAREAETGDSLHSQTFKLWPGLVFSFHSLKVVIIVIPGQLKSGNEYL